MKNFYRLFAITALTITFVCCGGKALAQGGGFGGGGGFDPQQMQQYIVNNMRDTMAVTNDDEWKVISPLLLKVVQARFDSFSTGMGGMFGGRNRGGGGGGGMAFGKPNPDAEALQTALDNNAPTPEIKAALAKFRESKKRQQEALAKAQAALKDVLSVRQEAALAMSGFLE